MSTNSYPPLRVAVLSGLTDLKERYDADPDFFDGPEVPYDKETIAALRVLFKPKIIKEIVEKHINVKEKAGRGRPSKDVALSEEDEEKIRKTIDDMMEALRTMGEDKDLAMNERIQIAKTKTALMKELLQMRERAFTIKRMSEFMETVMSILEDLVSEADRDIFLKRLEPFRS